MSERLQKILSRAGIASRRKAEEMILAGRVTVNGQHVREMGAKADLDRDHIKVDGKLVRPPKHTVYLALNKPRGYVTTMADPEGRPKVIDRLLLLTNDGDFANLLMKAGPQIPKTYWVKVSGKPDAAGLEKLRTGIRMDGRMTAPARIRPIKEAENPWYEVVLIEGRQNQIRRMFDRIGHLVEKLKRVKVGFLELGGLAPGEFRRLTPNEVERFKRMQPRKAAANPAWTKSRTS